MDKCVCVWVVLLTTILLPVMAGAFPADCSDSCLGDWQNESCNNLCQDESNGEAHCDFREAATDPVTEVYVFSSGGDLVIFGWKGANRFCCDSNDLGLRRLAIDTDDSGDLVCLRYKDANCDPGGDIIDDCDFDSGNEDWDHASLVRTRGGDDDVYGSDYDYQCGHSWSYWCDDIELGSGSSSGDVAYAGDGSDRVAGNGGVGMYAAGEEGEDKLRGTDDGDRLHGGDDADVIDGRDGIDTITTGTGGATENWVNGGDGADVIEGNTDDDVLCGFVSASGQDGDVDLINAISTVDSDICYDDSEDSLSNCETVVDGRCPNPPF